MPEITLEAIEQLLDKKLDEKLAPLATKADVENAVEHLARIVAETVADPFTKRFDDLEKKIDVTDQLKTFERKFKKIEEALHISL
jgi:uncharacterized protein YqgV (UPF0045/DUF77 family)